MIKIVQILLLLFLVSVGTFVNAKGRHSNPNGQITNFNQAKKFLTQNLELYDYKTIYCSCAVTKKTVDIHSCGYKIQSKKSNKRALTLEFEHVVPAEAFGQSFTEWRSGGQTCQRKGKYFKGRRCAKTNPEFAKMESDLYNLFPEIGELNGLRSNFSMAALTGSDYDFGECHVKLQARKFEPQESAKGIVARTYLNFENRYPHHGIVSDKNKKLFEAWDKQHPVSELECRRWKAFEKKNGYTHLFANRCSKLD